MTRKEFMAALEEALRSVPEETRAAALDFYGEMIDDRMEDGMDEVSAVAAMDAPEDIAARLRAENPGGRADEQQTDPDHFSSLAERVLKTVSQSLVGIPELVDASMSKAEETLEQATRQIEQASETAKASVTDESDRWKVFTCSAGQVRSIALYARDMPIRITSCPGDTLTLRYYSDPQQPYSLTLENGMLTLQHPEQSRFRDTFSLEKLNWLFSFGSNHPFPIIRLEMPPDLLVDLLAHTCNGSIKASGFTALCQVDLKTSNSRVELEDTVCKTLRIESSNGRLVLRNVESKQRIQCKTSNGRIEASRTQAGEELLLRTANGRILAEAVTAQGIMDAHTSNAPIIVDIAQAGGITLKTSNGRISGVLPGRQTDWAIDSGTSNGYHSLPVSQPGERPLSVHTSNGSIDIRFRDA